MQYLVSAMLIVVGVIHLLPLTGSLGPARLRALYGVSIEESNLEILMRHRAVLFAILGTFLLYAAFRPAVHLIALVAGFVSVISFIYLAWSVGGYNAKLRTVFRIDLAALACLLIAAAAYWRGQA